ncbi:MAG TPA: phage portal protein [Clostridiales bacterium]|nr:phage portal protein [Clostridiales bacterium]
MKNKKLTLFKRKKGAVVSALQTGRDRPSLLWNMTFNPNELSLYTALREAIPVIDAAIGKTVRLIGGFNVKCSQTGAQRALDTFLQNVPVGLCSTGIKSFISCYFDQLLTYGTAVGEMVTDKSGALAALYNANLSDIELIRQGPMQIGVGIHSGGDVVPVKRPDLILVSALNPTPGQVGGNSILKGLPFVSSILLNIFNTIGTNWERAGNIRYAVTYRPPKDGLDAQWPSERVAEIAREWSAAMSDTGSVKDFVSVGDVDIKVIGSDGPILDSAVPVRQLLEQIIAKLSIPPFMLGLSWSTTERMSSQQADMLTSELEYYRSLLTPVIARICRMFLCTHGYFCDFKVEWEPINLQDEVELAKARLLNARARQIEQDLKGCGDYEK